MVRLLRQTHEIVRYLANTLGGGGREYKSLFKTCGVVVTVQLLDGNGTDRSV